MPKQKNDWLYFANGITIKEVIPESYALKTPYADNIFSLCLGVLPEIDKHVEEIKVLKGFISRAKIFYKKEVKKLNKYEYAHTEGNAIEITWKNYDPDSALNIAKQIFYNYSESNLKKRIDLHVIINDDSVGFYFNVGSRKVLRKTNEMTKPSVLISE